MTDEIVPDKDELEETPNVEVEPDEIVEPDPRDYINEETEVIDVEAKPITDKEVRDGSPVIEIPPTVMTTAVKVVHPLFVDQSTGQHFPPPPGHKFQVAIQLSIGIEGKPLVEAPGLFYFSGNSVEEIAAASEELVVSALKEVQASANPVKIASSQDMEILSRTKPQ